MTDQDRTRWTKLVADFEASDLTQREFAAERGVSFSNLRNRIYKLRKESRPLVAEPTKVSGQGPERGAAPEGSRRLPVRVVASASKTRTTGAAGRGDEVLEIALPSGVRVRFPSGTDLKYLRALGARCGAVAVITIPRSVRIFIGSAPIDMRKSIDGLMAVVQEELGQDAYSGHLFVFVSRRADRVKILTWDKGGFILVYKRLERGQFKLPHMAPSSMAVEIDATQLAMLLDGIDFGRVRRPEHWKPHPRWIVRSVVVGVQVNDSTLGDYFHRTAEITKPISDRLLDVVSEKEIVLADETSHRVQAKGKTRRSWLWSFIAKDEVDREMIAYVFSPSRSSETPERVLEGTAGKLVADAYKGYDRVTLPGRRVRAGCLAHVRRKFFDAQSAAPDAAKQAMDFILEVYKIERAALDADLLGTPEHLEMRQTSSRAVMDEFKAGLDAEQGRHPPRGPMGEAINYALGNWGALTLFLTDPHLPIDNNASERALRVAALGRKNFLFGGTDEAGEHLAGLYSLIATCEVNGVNPVAYLADVLLRVQTHLASRIDELLPHNWTPLPREPPA